MKQLRFCLCCLAAVTLALAPVDAGASAAFAVIRNADRVNVRAGPGTGTQLLGKVNRGAWVELIDRQPGWIRCRVVVGQLTGYISASYLEESGGSSSTAVVNNPSASQYLNLRLYPSYSSPVLRTYRNGATCTVLSGSEGWFHVEIDGQRGYFRGEYLRFADGGLGETVEIFSANGGRVNLRTGPSYSYPVASQFAPGTRVAVRLKGNVFWQVTVGSAAGFIDSGFLRCSASAGDSSCLYNAYVTPTGVGLNLREQPSTDARALGVYPGNTRLLVKEQGSQWCRVKVLSDGREGYMMTAFLTLTGLPVTAAKVVRHPDKTYVNLRATPGVSAGNIIARVPHNSLVAVIAPGGTWTKVAYGSATGFMMSAFLK